MSCKKKEVSKDIIEKVKNFFQSHTNKSYRAWEIAEQLWLSKDDVSSAIKKLKEEWIITWKCAYKLI